MLTAILLATATPTPVTLADLKRFPNRFNGRMVEVTGQVDECWGMSCSLCPEQATPDHPVGPCLPMEFDAARSVLADEQRPEHGFRFGAAYRYASVVLIARFDSGCLTGACNDNATVIVDGRVSRVLRRRHSWEGLGSRRGKLFPVKDPDAAPVLAVFHEALANTPAEQADIDRQKADGTLITRDEMPELFAGVADADRVFTTDPSGRLSEEAIVCRTPKFDTEELHRADWPATQTAALYAPSTEDLFHCYFAFRRTGKWTIRLPMD